MNTRKQILAFVVSVVLATGLVPAAALAQQPLKTGSFDVAYQKRVAEIQKDADHYSSDEIIVVYEKGASTALRAQALSTMGAQDQAQPDPDNVIGDTEDGLAVVVDLPEGVDVASAVATAERQPGVAFAQPNYEYHLIDGYDQALVRTLDGQEGLVGRVFAAADLVSSPQSLRGVTTDKYVADQYYLDSWEDGYGASVVDAWDYVQSDSTVTVAVFDSGCYVEHEDLKDRLVTDYMRDVYNNTKPGVLITDNVPEGDNSGHGTHVAGIMAATADNGVGVAGVSYNAKVLPIKVFNDAALNPGASTDSIVRAFNYVMELVDDGSIDDLHVINMSLGGYGSSSEEDQLMKTAMSACIKRNIITVCAGGNGDGYGNARTDSLWPGDLPEAFAVTATNAEGDNAAFSDYNEFKDISGPGVNILSTYNSSKSSYGYLDGTSMASPLVGGVFALLWAANPGLTVEEAREAVTTHANPIPVTAEHYHGPSQTGSPGVIDAAAAVESVMVSSTGNLRISMKNCEFATVDDQYYNGYPLQPDVEVTYNGAVLTEGKDYRIIWKNNTDVGQATATVIGLDEYSGRHDVNFRIRNDIRDALTVFTGDVIGTSRYAYTGESIDYKLIVMKNNKILATGGDYSVKVTDAQGKEVKSIVDAGVYDVAVTGAGDWMGSIATQVAVVAPADLNALSADVAQATTLKGTAKVSKDGTDVSDSEKWVTSDVAENLQFAIDVAQSLVEAEEESSLRVEAAATNLSNASQAFVKAMKPGSLQATIAVADVAPIADQKFTGASIMPELSVTVGGKALTLGVDYTAAFKDNADVGTATVTLTGAGIYSGTKTETFSIVHAVDAFAFSDFTPGAWYLTEGQGSFEGTRTLYMDYTLSRKLMSGYSNSTKFGPDDNLTRAQVATILYRMANPDAVDTTDAAAIAATANTSGMTDVQAGQYYTAAVNWAVKEGIITGYANTTLFGPGDNVTREQLATMIWRYCTTYAGLEPGGANLAAFSDQGSISSFARGGVSYCLARGIMSGVGGSKAFDPAGKATRCQMAKIVAVAARMCDAAQEGGAR